MNTLSDEQRQIMREAVEEFNDQLATQSINLSGQAFTNALKLGCGLLALPLAIVLALTYFRRTLDFSAVFVYSCLALLIATAFASLIARRAKQLAIQDNYKLDINPEIIKFLHDNNFTRRQFDEVANEVLEDEAPLREYLVVPEDK